VPAAADLPDEDGSASIVRTKHFALKPMTPEEAVLQLELLGHAFYVFRNIENNEVSVVYRRDAGDYGLIEPSD
jgi:putative sigma-54 modulation protein